MNEHYQHLTQAELSAEAKRAAKRMRKRVRKLIQSDLQRRAITGEPSLFRRHVTQ